VVISRVRTKWGFVLPEGLYRLKQAHAEAVTAGNEEFEIDGHPYVTSFVGYLIEFCETQGLVAVPTESSDPVFVP
jgi:hypothetical protein